MAVSLCEDDSQKLTLIRTPPKYEVKKRGFFEAIGIRSKETLVLHIDTSLSGMMVCIDDYLDLSRQLLTRHFLELNQVTYMLCLLLPSMEYRNSTGCTLYCYIGSHSPIYSLGDFKRIYTVDYKGTDIIFTIEQTPEKAQKVYLKSEAISMLSKIIQSYTEVSAYSNRSTAIAKGNKAMVRACTEAIKEQQETVDLQIDYQREVKILKQKKDLYDKFVKGNGYTNYQIGFLTRSAIMPTAPAEELEELEEAVPYTSNY